MRSLAAACVLAVSWGALPATAAPGLAYSTYLGGEGFGLDTAYGIGTDGAGAIYLTGVVASTGFPTTEDAFQETNPGNFSAYVAKLSPDGAKLEWSTFLGGSDLDIPEALAVDAEGHAYVVGYTRSLEFPVTDGAAQMVPAPSADAFVAKLSPDGERLEYATYLGGEGWDRAMDVAIDASGNAFVTGFTASEDFPTTAGAFQTVKGTSGDDAFVTKVSADGTRLLYSTFLGGNSSEVGEGLAVDAAGSAYVTGITSSTDFPTKNPFQPVLFPGLGLVAQGDAFVTKLSPGGDALVYSSYLGGFDGENSQAVAVDASGSAYVAGLTRSPNFPVTLNAHQLFADGGGFDAFVSRVAADGSSLVYSSYLGGGGVDMARGVEAGASGRVFVTGETTSSDFPSASPLQGHGGGTDAFFTEIDTAAAPAMPSLRFSTHLGGSGEDYGHDLHRAGDTVLLAGYSTSGNFPMAGPSIQTSLRGRIDALACVIRSS